MIPGAKGTSLLVVAHRFSLGFGGVPESILLLARELDKLGIRLDVFSRDGFVPDAGALQALPAAPAPGRSQIGALDVAAYDCVLIAGAWNRAAWLIGAQARRKGVRLVYTPKGNLARAEFKRLRDLKKFPYLVTAELSLLAMSDQIVFSSDLERRASLLARLFDRKAIVILEPYLGPQLGPARPPRSDPIRFGFMAEIAPRKGLADLVGAFTAWQAKGNLEAELHIAGEPRPGSERYYARVLRMAAISPRPEKIVFLGPLRGQKRDDFYEQIDVFACPTRFESFGLTPLEALWHGKPVMVTENLGILEFVTDVSSMISLGKGTLDEIEHAFGAAAAARSGYLAAAARWRMCPNPCLSGDRLAVAFARVIGMKDAARRV